MTAPMGADARYRALSLWFDAIAEPLVQRAALTTDRSADVTVVGAGMTGLWAAYYLKLHSPDLRVAVLERDIAGFGASGRNGGWAGAGIAGDAAVYRRRRGDEAVRSAVHQTNLAVDEIERVTREEGIDCGFAKGGTLTVATSEPQLDRLVEAVRHAERSGLLSEGERLLTADESDRLVRVSGRRGSSFYTPHCARLDPARLVRGLARACEGLGVDIYEGSEAVKISPGRVVCPSGAVQTECVLRATESYTVQLPGQARRYLPLYSLMVATEPLAPAIWDELGWPHGLTLRDRRHLFFYAQRTADDRIAIGGRGAPYRLRRPISADNERNADVRGRLVDTLRRHFPPVSGAAITHHWGGPIAVPRDWCMAVHYDRRTKVGAAGGYGGHGVVAANISGRTLADLVLGHRTELTTMPWVDHRARRWEPEPVRYLASAAIVRVLATADRREDRTGRRAYRSRLVAPFTAQA